MSANTKGTTKQRTGCEADADYTNPRGSSAEWDCRIAGPISMRGMIAGGSPLRLPTIKASTEE